MLAKNEINAQNPSSLFKFFRFDKNALSGLIKGTLWFADPRSFNDPFDMFFIFDESFTNDELATHLNNCAVARGEPQKYTVDNVQDERDGMLQLLAQTRDAILACGIASFSATPYESLMWSHYADQHRGFCIEFERNSTNELGGSACRPVNYRDNVNSIVDGLDFFRDPDAALHAALYTKASCWNYELEWRLLYLSREPGALVREKAIDARMKSIIFGLRASESDISTVAKLFEGRPDVKFYIMRTTGQNFDLKPVLIGRVIDDTG